jgi:hypothetical protein
LIGRSLVSCRRASLLLGGGSSRDDGLKGCLDGAPLNTDDSLLAHPDLGSKDFTVLSEHEVVSFAGSHISGLFSLYLTILSGDFHSAENVVLVCVDADFGDLFVSDSDISRTSGSIGGLGGFTSFLLYNVVRAKGEFVRDVMGLGSFSFSKFLEAERAHVELFHGSFHFFGGLDGSKYLLDVDVNGRGSTTVSDLVVHLNVIAVVSDSLSLRRFLSTGTTHCIILI